MTWITNWDDLDDLEKYYVCPIYQNNDSPDTYLGSPWASLTGLEIRRRLQARAYAALAVPVWQGLPPAPKPQEESQL